MHWIKFYGCLNEKWIKDLSIFNVRHFFDLGLLCIQHLSNQQFSTLFSPWFYLFVNSSKVDDSILKGNRWRLVCAELTRRMFSSRTNYLLTHYFVGRAAGWVWGESVLSRGAAGQSTSARPGIGVVAGHERSSFWWKGPLGCGFMNALLFGSVIEDVVGHAWLILRFYDADFLLESGVYHSLMVSTLVPLSAYQLAISFRMLSRRVGWSLLDGRLKTATHSVLHSTTGVDRAANRSTENCVLFASDRRTTIPLPAVAKQFLPCPEGVNRRCSCWADYRWRSAALVASFVP
jgi:hypothetical protein